ncbi:Rpn family recombination-promoting nuclease/putative transposase [Schinkia azotoformans]|uniref:Rpn family recombination-promoting nuclease/putative transposase n=1 Tax=Schinkia azotoformans TaxID=1454 RepID=UPI002DBD5C2C|nr:Rpn family recombination-promoting nuclease/putative transposase [Schinkia azotoformans]MEC1723083.1 Rpn family recombination-promoting nuclease/putative transposase [Schinkia azotoformans]MED4414723.1 Rpn family recombination-promoting nuclease/putative transposase [Schinkia azotoformans]
MERLLKRIPLHNLMDLKIDFAFKGLFGNEKNKHITIIFLNAILKRKEEDCIIDISFENTEFVGEHPNDKKSRLDILAKTNKQERVNIEIQFSNQYDMVKRSLFYWAGLYRDPLMSGGSYIELKPVITINILNFVLFNEETDKFHTTFHLYEDEEKFPLTSVLEMHFIEMPKLLQDWKQKRLNPRDDVLARWLLLLGIVDRKNKKVYEDIYKELEEIAMSDSTLKEAFKDWEHLSADKNKWLEYETRLKEVLDAYSAQHEAELRAKREREEGRAEGLAEGKKAIARNMLKEGFTFEQIEKVTGLAIEEIKQLMN